ncbi:MAG: sigma factor-like helix-turn-helix DNA-binding protein [Solirubrobacteraceae bacterium]
MASLDSLPADQRAVLQLVLVRARSYDEIAQLLSIDRAGVRQRALAALDALGPHTRVDPQRRALITDYLLGQLPPRVGEDTRAHLARSAGERAWARVVASELAPLAPDRLPEIPAESGRRSEAGAAEPARRPEEPAGSTTPSPVPTASPPSTGAARRTSPESKPDSAALPSSRRGGGCLLAFCALVVVIVVVIVIATSGSSPKHNSSASKPTAPSTTTSGLTSATTASAPTGPAGTRGVRQLNLSSPTAGSKTVGIAEVLKRGTTTEIAIVAQGVTPNTGHDAYAVWLFNSPTDSHILGFVNPPVGANGRLSTAGALPANAAHYRHLLVSLERQANPHAPGKIILQGPLSGV